MGGDVEKIENAIRGNPKNVSFLDLFYLCKHFFGEPGQNGSSHIIFKTPWKGDPRINIQKDGKMAKNYQVRQVLKAIDKFKDMYGTR